MSDRILFYIHDDEVHRADFAGWVEDYTARFDPHRRIIIRPDNPVRLNAAMIAARDTNKELFVCHDYFSDGDIRRLYQKHQCDMIEIFSGDTVLLQEEEPKVKGDTGYLYVFTSGTTGEAKCARHRWNAIEYSSGFVGSRLKNKTWMQAYSPTSYAGLQVFFSAYNNGGIIYYPPDDYEKTARGMVRFNVEVLSATPTYWRLLIASWPDDLPVVRLEQATLGGEVIGQDILDAVRGRFDPGRLTHIYASTEAGTAIVVSDGLAGFPETMLTEKRETVLRIVDDTLEIKAPAAMEGYLGRDSNIDEEGWVKTGDMVEKRGDRFFFLGRSDGMINVGGLKVIPEEVEEALNNLEEIRDSHVFARKSPIVGALVMAEVVVKAGTEFDEPALKDKLKKSLAEHKIPKVIVPVEQIGISEHGKKIRRSE